MTPTTIQEIRMKVAEAHQRLRSANQTIALSSVDAALIDAIGLLGAALLMMVDAMGREAR